MPQGNNLTTLAAAEDVLIAAGDQGTVMLSEDGQSWEQIDIDSTVGFSASAYAADLFLLAGFGTILSSVDGREWTEVLDTENVNVRGLAYGNGVWMAAGSFSEQGEMNAVVFTSYDGEEWDRTDLEISGSFFVADLAFGADDRFVLTGLAPGAQTSTVLTSDDSGENWTPNADSLDFTVQSLAWSGENFAAAGSNGSIAFSEDGLVWETRNEGSHMSLRQIIHSDGLWLAGGLSFAGNREPGLLYSSDGIEWQERVLPHSESFPIALGYFAGQFHAVGLNGAVFRGPHPDEMEPAAAAVRLPLNGIAYDGARYVAVGGATPPELRVFSNPIPGNMVGGHQTILTSTGLDDWTEVETEGEEPLYDVAYGNGRFVAVGKNGTVLTSENGLEWNARDSGANSNLTGVVYGNGYFVAVGRNSSYIGISSDGITWSEAGQVPFVTEGLSAVTFAEGRFVAAGSTPEGILHATDPNTWERSGESFDEATLLTVAHGVSGFVAAGFRSLAPHSGFILTSQNGIDWVEATDPGPVPITAVTSTPQGYLAAGGYFDHTYEGGYTHLRSSTDGMNWTETSAFPRPRLTWAFLKTEEGIVGVGDGGAIVSISFSEPAIDEHPQSLTAFQEETVEFSVTASHPQGESLSYQWFFEGDPIEANDRITGSNSPDLRIENLNLQDAGVYTVTVAGSGESVTSLPAVLTVGPMLRVSLDFDDDTPGWGVSRFASLQEAIDHAPDDEASKIVVEPGIYHETIRLHGRPAIISSADPEDPEIVAATIIDGAGSGDSVVAIIDGEDNRTQIRGLTVQNGGGSNPGVRGAGLRIQNATPVIEYNRILSNSGETDSLGGGIYAAGANLPQGESLILRRNLIQDNHADSGGGLFLGIRFVVASENMILHNTANHTGGGIVAASIPAGRGYLEDTEVTIVHSVLYGNRAASDPAARLEEYGFADFANNIVVKNRAIAALDALERPYGPHQTVMSTGNFSVRYNNFWKNEVEERGSENLPYGQHGNITFAPLFADPENLDFRLRSQAGRWDPENEVWITDEEHSPLIAAGAPDGTGNRFNMGVFGLSETASLPLEHPVVSIGATAPGNLDRLEERPLFIVLGRTGSLDSALPIGITTGGDAEPGIDFSETTVPDAFPPGEAAIAFEINPLPVESPRGHRERTYTVGTSDGFFAGYQGVASVMLWDLAFHDWMITHFPGNEWQDQERAGPFADPDDTGILNLQRAAFGLGPGDPASNHLPQVAGVSGPDPENGKRIIRIAFTRPVPHQEIEYALEGTADMSQWTPVEPDKIVVESGITARTERVTLEFADEENRFFRILTSLEINPILEAAP